MSFDAKQFCDDHGIHTAPGGKHYRAGWVNISCPLCSGNPGYHGGFNLKGGYYNCHRCGNQWLPKVVSALLNKSIRVAKEILKPYLSKDLVEEFRERKYAEQIKFPPGTTRHLNDRNWNYLYGRYFTPRDIDWIWNLHSTGHLGPYKFRILAPIYLNGDLVSYQCRATSETQSQKYLACPEDEEVYHHKFTLYGIDYCTGDSCLVVEGITDVWRMGPGAVATFGIEYTKQQLLMLSRRFKKVHILFDPESQAQQQADKLYIQLSALGTSVHILYIENYDPAEMSDEDASNVMKSLNINNK